MISFNGRVEIIPVKPMKPMRGFVRGINSSIDQGSILPLDTEDSLEAAAVGLAENLATADSIIYTMALKHDASLWTQESHFKGKPLVHYHPKSP